MSAYLSRPCRPIEQALAEVQMTRAAWEICRTPKLAHLKRLVPGWMAALKESRQ